MFGKLWISLERRKGNSVFQIHQLIDVTYEPICRIRNTKHVHVFSVKRTLFSTAAQHDRVRNFIKIKIKPISTMVATKKRPAESSTDGDVKKVKLEKNSQFKRNDGHRPDAKSSPFKRNDGQRPDGRKPFGKPGNWYLTMEMMWFYTFRYVSAGAGAKPWQKNSSNNKFSKGKGQPHLGPSAKFGAGGGGGRPIKQEKNDKEQTSTEKTDWTKFKKEKKELKLQRKTKSNKDYYEMTNQAKQIYESLKWWVLNTYWE